MKSMGSLLCAVLCAALASCVSMPDADVTASQDAEQMRTHVGYLAHPALGGRRPMTRGSYRARRYIKDRFEACGLVPWGEAHGYAQSIKVGANVVAVLPAADGTVDNGIVLVCAHYDHLGHGHLGAADNASGVAALLEIAETLSSQSTRPARPVAFAAFDWEERGLFGSFAFTCRDDYAPDRIAAVVNIDVLGRRALDIMDNTLFLIGSETHRGVRRVADAAGEKESIRVLPVGSDLIGPRSDHVAFAFQDFPSLFFTSGTYGDYHRKTDTADRVDYDLLTRSSRTIAATVTHLANAESIEGTPVRTNGDRDELAALTLLAREALAHKEELGFAQEGICAYEDLLAEADSLLNDDTYTFEQRRRFLGRASQTMVPLIEQSLLEGGKPSQKKPRKERGKSQGATMTLLQALWLDIGAECTEGYRGFVDELLARNLAGLALVGMPLYDYSFCKLPKENVTLSTAEEGVDRLSVLFPSGSVSIDLGPLFRPHGGLSFSWDVIDCTGTTEELIDYVLLAWATDTTLNDGRLAWTAPKDRFRIPMRLRISAAQIERWTHAVLLQEQAWNTVLTQVAPEAPEGFCETCLEWRLKTAGFADEEAWVKAQLRGTNPRVVHKALDYARQAKHTESCDDEILRIALDETIPPKTRVGAMKAYAASGKSLDPLKPLLADEKPIDPLQGLSILDESFPYYDQPLSAYLRTSLTSAEGKKAEKAAKQFLPKVDGKRVHSLAEAAQRLLQPED